MKNKRNFDFLSNEWHGLEKIVVFGFGKMGRGNIEALLNRFQIIKIIDNDIKLSNKSYKNIEIINLNTYVKLELKEKIVVVTSGNRYNSISKELEKRGFTEYVDFCDFSTFCSDYFWNDRKELFLGRLTFNITTFCTLNCKSCTMLTPFNKYKKNFEIDTLKKDVVLTFEIVDYVSNLIVLGGEPFLHKELAELIEFIGEGYRDKIGNVQLITNGMVLASKELLSIIRKYDVEVRISDYTQRVNYKERLKQFCNDLDLYEIRYVCYSHDKWLDMGFPDENVNMGDNEIDLRKHMLNCNPNCQNVSEGKLYYCAQGWAAEQSGLFKLDETDYLNLAKVVENVNKKEEFRRFYFGHLDKGYFSFCKVCRGWDTNITIPGGIQI